MKDWWTEQFPKGRQTFTIKDAQNNPVNLAYGEKGTGKPLIFVHGLGMWSVTWRYNIDFFSRYFRVICVDTKGYGFSDKPDSLDDCGYKIVELSRILEALCDQPAIVVTQSLWGTVSLVVAVKSPELISALIVIDPAVFPTELPTLGMKIMARLPMGLVRIFDRLRITKYTAPAVRLFLRQQRSKTVVRGRIPDEDIYWKAYPYIEFPNTVIRLIMDIKQSQEEIEQFSKNKPCSLSFLKENLSKVHYPTLVLWGEKDAWFSPEEGQKLVERLPQGRLTVIPNCGHDASADCNEEINDAILNFLKDVELVELVT